MGRWYHLDTDAERLPPGMQRTGYDADTQTYHYRDAAGTTYEGAPGCEYGELREVSGQARQLEMEDVYEMEGGERQAQPATPEISWRHGMMPLLNFFLIVGVFLTGVVWFLHGGSGPVAASCGEGAVVYKVKTGDTCWAIAQSRGMDLADFLKVNPGLDCDRLIVGGRVCVGKS